LDFSKIHRALEQKSDAFWALLVFFASFILFFWDIGHPRSIYYDETHYVPAARYFLGLGPLANLEHPPLGKILIAAGMFLFGDGPVGWRFFSVLTGALIVPIVFLASRKFGWSRLWSLWVCLALAANQMLFVQARIATLDIYFVFFSILSVYAYLRAFRASHALTVRRELWVTGAALGLAMACKWSALPLVLLALVGQFAFRRATLRFIPQVMLAFSVAYLLPFAPYVLKGDWTVPDLVLRQFDALALQQQVGGKTHGYMSAWWEWPLMNRPTWYFFESADGYFRGILSLGNPFLFWTGFVLAVGLLVRLAMSRAARTLPAVAVSALYWVNFLFWAFTARKLMFFYYYFLPSLFLPWAAAECIRAVRDPLSRRGLALGYLLLTVLVFIYFYPVLAGVREPLSRFGFWAWFRRWV